MAGVCTGPGPCDTTPTGTGDNWVTRHGGLPVYIRAVVHAFKRKGVPEQMAVQRAIGVIRDWAAGKGHVSAATRARAAKALAEWEALRAKTRSHDHSREASSMTVDLAASSRLARLMPDRAAVVALAKKAEKWPAARRDPMKKVIAARARQLGMEPDGDGDYDYDVPARTDMSVTAAERARSVTYPGTSKFPIRNQADFTKAWDLRGNSTIPKAAVEKWLRGVAHRFGYKIPGGDRA